MIIITERQALFALELQILACAALARVRHFTPEQRPLRSVRQLFQVCKRRPSESYLLTHPIPTACTRADWQALKVHVKCDLLRTFLKLARRDNANCKTGLG